MRYEIISLCAAVAAIFSVPADSAPAAVDLELVIAADTSTSIDDREAALERQGVASAFRSPDVQRAITSGALGRIAVLYLDWSGGPNNRIVANWTTVSDKRSAGAFADAVLSAPRTYGRGTSLGAALEMGAALIEFERLSGNPKGNRHFWRWSQQYGPGRRRSPRRSRSARNYHQWAADHERRLRDRRLGSLSRSARPIFHALCHWWTGIVYPPGTRVSGICRCHATQARA